MEAGVHPIRRVGGDSCSIFHWAVYIGELYDELTRLPCRTEELGQVRRRWLPKGILNTKLPRMHHLTLVERIYGR